MRFHVHESSLHLSDAPTRLPFRFGAVTLRHGRIATACVRVRGEDGRTAEGFSSDLLVPKWFDKDPHRSAEDNVADLVASATAAAESYTSGTAAGTAFDHWLRVQTGRPVTAETGLLRGFGVALFERALIDAACRATERGFHAALLDGTLGFAPGRLRDELSDWQPDELPARPLGRVRVRHTVGMLDALRAAELAPGDRIDDGLPQALEEDIERYGLSCFKLKLGGDPARDVPRLVAIAAVLERVDDGALLVTVDANEQYPDLHTLARTLDGLERDPVGRRLFEALAYIEQPLPRHKSFDPACTAGLGVLPVPVLLDEADYGPEAFPLALELGYGGVSAKNCKGVFRALAHHALCQRVPDAFQSAEDLTTLGVLALQQDLATVATLGLAHVERNGHHYFPGLDHLPAAEAREALLRHPDLYEAQGPRVQLRIRAGELELGSLLGPGFGHDVRPHLDGRELVARCSNGDL